MLERLVILGMLVGAYLILSCRGCRIKRDKKVFSPLLDTFPQEKNLGNTTSYSGARGRMYPGAMADVYLTSYREN